MSSKQANNVTFSNVLEAPFNKEGLRSPEPDDELKHLKLILHNAVIAQKRLSKYTQVQVDEIFKAAACAQWIPLAIMAVEETKMGVIEDKVIKNHFASEFIYNEYKNQKTCDIIEHVDCALENCG
ncbi:hypothetical protein CEUSTIGMA_g10991.t1 [Chlamydomonas eustigma]|uniref:Uncharacterized protein n=1 Tax=Chlamydomonas eustigma TaxID=1157962 RepID=A0A250XKM5_9CHLO|nr:hypothetical protein CEUSTIGMA_g10991.t1 [Chlamydomonas eustigma]|eukprot:GAX83566.1 hypothetical protein CEUSTIGMA_g10991.t1 [Chlamydomonas eustigma]